MNTFDNLHSLALLILRLRQGHHQSIKSLRNLTLLFSLAFALICPALLSGCAQIQIKPHTQDEVMSLVEPFEMRIDKSYWEGESLVVELTLSNHGRQSDSFGTVRAIPMFELENAQGLRYSRVINYTDDLTTGAVLGGNVMNPGMSLKRKIIFKVPKGEYVMLFSLGTTNGTFFYSGRTRFTWTLNPSGK